jgi:hypothetical protein
MPARATAPPDRAGSARRWSPDVPTPFAPAASGTAPADGHSALPNCSCAVPAPESSAGHNPPSLPLLPCRCLCPVVQIVPRTDSGSATRKRPVSSCARRRPEGDAIDDIDNHADSVHRAGFFGFLRLRMGLERSRESGRGKRKQECFVTD